MALEGTLPNLSPGKHNSAPLLTKNEKVQQKSNGLFVVNLLPAPLFQVVAYGVLSTQPCILKSWSFMINVHLQTKNAYFF